MNLLECLVEEIGKKIAAKVPESTNLGILARRFYTDDSFSLVDVKGEKLTPRGDVTLIGYHLPGERRPSIGIYQHKEVTIPLTCWIFGGIPIGGESSLLRIATAIESTKSIDQKKVEIVVKSYTDDIMSIIQQDFPAYRNQFQDKQPITSVMRFKYEVKIYKCC